METIYNEDAVIILTKKQALRAFKNNDEIIAFNDVTGERFKVLSVKEIYDCFKNIDTIIYTKTK